MGLNPKKCSYPLKPPKSAQTLKKRSGMAESVSNQGFARKKCYNGISRLYGFCMDFPIWFSHENQDVQLPTSRGMLFAPKRCGRMFSRMLLKIISYIFTGFHRIPTFLSMFYVGVAITYVNQWTEWTLNDRGTLEKPGARCSGGRSPMPLRGRTWGSSWGKSQNMVIMI